MPLAPASPSSMSEWVMPSVLTAAAVGVIFLVARLGHGRERRNATTSQLRLDDVEGSVLFFSDAACRRCDLVRDRLESIGADFVEIAFNHEPDLQRAIGVTGVPLLVIRDEGGTIVGRIAGVASAKRIGRVLARSRRLRESEDVDGRH